ncbi:unnamed protein product, partial [marine sediment metagenome]
RPEFALDRSGWSVSLSADGQTVAIGAPYNDGTTSYVNSSVGHVRIYRWTGSTWQQLGIDIDGEAANDHLGTSVSLSADGQTVAIGASTRIHTMGVFNTVGHVRIYRWTGSTWQQLGVDIDGEADGDYSGTSVSLSADGQTVAIGAPGNDGTAFLAGHVRIYQLQLDAFSLSTLTDTISVTIEPVNEQPTLDAIVDITTLEDAATQTVILSGITAGGSETQPLRVTAISSDSGLIPDPPVLYSSPGTIGELLFTPAADQHGTATITVTVEDGGLDGVLETAE